MPCIVLLTGVPGSGKSTLAEAAAKDLGAPVFAWDWIMGSFTEFEEVQAAFRQMHRERSRALAWSVIWNLSMAQLRSGRSVVIDGVARHGEVRRVREIAGDHGVESHVVWTTCSDLAIHRVRIEGRVRNIPGWHELEWTHVEAVRSALAEPSDVDLRLDAVQPLDVNLGELRNVLRTETSGPRPSTTYESGSGRRVPTS